MTRKNMGLLWNAGTHSYQAIQELDGEWFVVRDLGIDYHDAKEFVADWNNRIEVSGNV